MTGLGGHPIGRERGVHDADEASARSVRNCVSQTDRDKGSSHYGLTDAERNALRGLRRGNPRRRAIRTTRSRRTFELRYMDICISINRIRTFELIAFMTVAETKTVRATPHDGR